MLKMDNVQKHYGDFCLDCSLKVAPGQITGLIGQNGAGKTTAFKAILGLIQIDGGTITLFGHPDGQKQASLKEDLGIVFSDSGFSGYLSIQDLVSIMKHLYARFDAASFLEDVKRYQLPLQKKIRTFSTGMKAKLKVLLALSYKARLLILDEPTAGLDVLARDQLLDRLREYLEEDLNRSILISSHISSDLETLCDDLYMIHEGKVIFHEQTDVLLDRYGILKMSFERYKQLDQRYLLKTISKPYGIDALTNQRNYYMENAPDISIEKGSIDEIILMMIKGETR